MYKAVLLRFAYLKLIIIWKLNFLFIAFDPSIIAAKIQ